MINYLVYTDGYGVPYELIVQANSRQHAKFMCRLKYPGFYQIYKIDLMDSSN